MYIYIYTYHHEKPTDPAEVHLYHLPWRTLSCSLELPCAGCGSPCPADRGLEVAELWFLVDITKIIIVNGIAKANCKWEHHLA